MIRVSKGNETRKTPPRYRSLAAFIQWQQAPRPIDWRQTFGRSAPLVLELGFGNGEYLVDQAKSRQDKNWIGIDQTWASVLRALRGAPAAKLSNVRVLYGDARVVLERGFPPESLDDAYALFPCPWPKTAHARHRLFGRTFLRLMNSRLAEGRSLRILTDERRYHDWILGQTDPGDFTLSCRTVDAKGETLYARKWLEAGHKVFYEIRLRKERHCPIPLKEDYPMHTYRAERFNPEAFTPQDARGPVTVEFKEFLFDPKRERAMTRVMVVEEPFEQDLWIEIVRVEDSWHVRPSWGCRMVPTAGVQLALDLVYDAVLRSVHSPSSIVHGESVEQHPGESL